MAEGFARKAGWLAFSAGTKPEKKVNPLAIKVMAEFGIDISCQIPQSVGDYVNEDFHIVATVCDNARETCPVFTGNCKHNLHQGFPDPANESGTQEEIIAVYRAVRNEIRDWIKKITCDFNNSNIKKKKNPEGPNPGIFLIPKGPSSK